MQTTSTPATALFVDAGWVHAAAALAVGGMRDRCEVTCRYPEFVRALSEVVSEHSGGMRLLRTYWYDASIEARPTAEHHRIALIPYVTLRLGRLSRGRTQKGVDIRIYRDLVQLARERAITRAYLVAGDEDLLEAVVDAKELGVQVVLLGMPADRGHNQSGRLVREADAVVRLPERTWRPHFGLRERVANSDDDLVAQARALGEEFATQWARRTAPADVERFLQEFPTLPRELDVDLLVFAERDMGSLRGRPDLKGELRGMFWLALKEIADRGVGGAAVASAAAGERVGARESEGTCP